MGFKSRRRLWYNPQRTGMEDDIRKSDLLCSDPGPLCPLRQLKCAIARGPALAGPSPPTPAPLQPPRGPWVLSNMGWFPSCLRHFYLLSHKALESSESGMSRCLHNAGREGDGEQGPYFCRADVFCTSPSQLSARASWTVEALAVDNCQEHPRPSLVSRQNFGGRTSLLPGKPVCSLERKPQWLGCSGAPRAPPKFSSLQNGFL